MNERRFRLLMLMLTALTTALLAGACGDQTDSETSTLTAQPPAPEGSPRWIAEKFFARDTFPEAGMYLDGSVKQMYDQSGSTFGATLAPEVKTHARELQKDTSKATVAVTIADTAVTFDLYCYFDRGEDGWKLNTLRSLSGTGLMWAVVAECDTMATIPDSMRYGYENCKLTISCDSVLKAFLLDHQAPFDEIVSILNDNAIRVRVTHNDTTLTVDQPRRQVAGLLRQLHLASVEADSTGRVEVLVGGVTDNMVCFLYVPESAIPPTIDRDNIIYVEPIIGRWYVFKTT